MIVAVYPLPATPGETRRLRGPTDVGSLINLAFEQEIGMVRDLHGKAAPVYGTPNNKAASMGGLFFLYHFSVMLVGAAGIEQATPAV